MGFLEDLGDFLSGASTKMGGYGGAAGAVGSIGETVEETAARLRRDKAIKCLVAEGILLGGGAVALAAYSPRKRKRKGSVDAAKAAEAANGLSKNLAGVLTSPLIALPLAYINIQWLEDAGVISGGLGDAAQGLMTAAVGSELIKGVI